MRYLQYHNTECGNVQGFENTRRAAAQRRGRTTSSSLMLRSTAAGDNGEYDVELWTVMHGFGGAQRPWQWQGRRQKGWLRAALQ
jgi:hypothetical protein